MKKKLSLLVALLMVLTLIPFNAFAVKTDFNAKQTVDEDAEDVSVSAVLDIQPADEAAITTGTVAVYLGENAEFKTFEVQINGAAISGKVKPDPDNTFALINLDATDIGNLKKGIKQLSISGTVKLDSAKVGDQKWIIDATGIKLSKYERVYAVVDGENGKFSKRIGDIKIVGRGDKKQLSTVELKNEDGKNKFALRLPSDEFEWDKTETETLAVNAKKFEVSPVDERVLTFEVDSDKAAITPVINVKKDAPYGEIEFEISRGKDYYKNSKSEIKGVDKEVQTEYVKLGDYREFGVVLKTVKDVKEVFVNGDVYNVDMELKTDNKEGLARYYDFTVDGGDVWITNVSPSDMKKVKSDAPETELDSKGENQATDKFTINVHDRDINKVKFTLNVRPDWDAKGEVVVKAKSRYGEEAECVALKLIPVASLKTECKEILAGERKIDLNDVVITETQAGALKPGTKYAVSLKKMKFDQAKFENKGAIEAEGIRVKDLKLGKDDKTIYFTVDGRSKKDAPAKIVLKDLSIVTDRALPLGNYDLLLGYLDDNELKSGEAEKKDYYVRTKDGYFEVKEIATADFFKAVSELGRVKKTTVFTLGSGDYTVDGAMMKLDNPVFTQDNYTMLPVRAIADALGVEVVWNQENKTATFIDGDKVVSITVNSKVLYKNGIAYPMATKSSVKAERMFISVASVGDAFGLNRGMDYIYDEAAKTVTIYPKADMMKKADK